MGHMVRTVRLDMPEMIPPHCLGRRASASLTGAHSNRGRSLVMKKYQLMAPGPTPVPSEVLLAMARPIIHHRAPEYDALFREVREALKRLVQTREDVLTPACTGTGEILIVDAGSSLGIADLPMDAWGIDVIVSASQKGLMLPPGLGLLALSEKAWGAGKQSKLPKYYLDLAEERKYAQRNEARFTHAVWIM